MRTLNYIVSFLITVVFLLPVLPQSDTLTGPTNSSPDLLNSSTEPDYYWIDEPDLVVYYRPGIVTIRPLHRFDKRLLPTRNLFKSTPGCYIACYSKQNTGSIYEVGAGIQVMGQVRVKGNYEGRICRPAEHQQDDISVLQKFKEICANNIKSCGPNCWAGGDTGGWFGR